MKSLILYLALLQSLGCLAFASPAAQANNPIPPEDNKGLGPDHASTLLDSIEAADRAWGAYLVGRHHMTSLQPKLESLLPEILASNDQYLIHSFLEAEIQLGAVLPEEIMRRIYDGCPSETLVLFLAAPQNYRKTIMSLFQKETFSLEWFALGNLLLKIKEKEFLMLMMTGIKQIPINVRVYDIVVPEGGGGSLGPAGNYQTTPARYPPYIYYSLRASASFNLFMYFRTASSSNVGLAFPGPAMIFAERIVVHPGDSYFPENIWRYYKGFINYMPPDIYGFRQKYVSAFLDLPAEDVALEQPLWVKWEGKAKYKAALAAHCRKILAMYDRITTLLLDRGLIQSSQAKTLKGIIALKIVDSRKNKTVPLPNVFLNRVTIEKQK
jgi:hypothetical protein